MGVVETNALRILELLVIPRQLLGNLAEEAFAQPSANVAVRLHRDLPLLAVYPHQVWALVAELEVAGLAVRLAVAGHFVILQLGRSTLHFGQKVRRALRAILRETR